MHLLLRYFDIKISVIWGINVAITTTFTNRIGSRIRKSPYYESDLKYGVTASLFIIKCICLQVFLVQKKNTKV